MFDGYYNYNPKPRCIHQKACMLHRKVKPKWCDYDLCSEFIDENGRTACQTVDRVEAMISDIMDDIFDRGKTRRDIWDSLKTYYDEREDASWYEGICVGDVLDSYDNYHSMGDDDCE